jgi:hypothetical protein
MKNAILSVGLNVTGSNGVQYEPPKQLADTLSGVAGLFDLWRMSPPIEGEWDGVKERTVHYRVTAESTHAALAKASQLAEKLGQSCIAVLFENANTWILANRDGSAAEGGTVQEFPPAIAFA